MSTQNSNSKWPWEHDPQNPNATPDPTFTIPIPFTGIGLPFDFSRTWGLADWKTWYYAMVDAFGQTQARINFVAAGNELLQRKWFWAPPAGFDMSPQFVDWLRENGLQDAIENDGLAALIADIFRPVNRALQIPDNLMSYFSKAAPWIVIGAAAIYLLPKLPAAIKALKGTAKAIT